MRPTQTQSQFCKDPFAADKISEKEKEMSYKECEERPNQNVYCRKLIQNGKCLFLSKHRNNPES